VLGDVLDKEKLIYMFQTYQIDSVIHCAAYMKLFSIIMKKYIE